MMWLLVLGVLLIIGAVGFSFIPAAWFPAKPKQVLIQTATGPAVTQEPGLEEGIFMVRAEPEPSTSKGPDVSSSTNTIQASCGVGVLEQYKASIPLRKQAIVSIATLLQEDRETDVLVVAVKRQLKLALDAPHPEPAP